MLTGWVAAVIGIIIVVFSLKSLIREIRKGGIPNMEDQSFSDTFYALLNRVDKLGENLDDINQTFYDTAERLEKRIEALERKSPSADSRNRPRQRDVQDRVPAGKPETGPEGRTSGSDPKLTEEGCRASEIRKRLSQGKDNQQVARELSLGVGEVELIRRLKHDLTDPKAEHGKNPKSPD